MSPTEAGVLIVAVLALVAIFSFLKFRKRTNVEIKGPGKTGLKINASNDPSPAVVAKDLKSRKGGAVIQDKTGRGADVSEVDVETDIRITSEGQPPKA